MDGAVGAVETEAGKIAARLVPQALKLPGTGNAALAIQALVGVAIGWAATEFMSPEMGKMLLIGGLQAPLETVIERANIAHISDAVSGVVPAGTVSGYAQLLPAPRAALAPAHLAVTP